VCIELIALEFSISSIYRDRRSLGTSQKPSGVLIGHTEGITYVSAKGDGCYVISNGKDQALRLWDLRKMRSTQEVEAVKGKSYSSVNFDYRFVKPWLPANHTSSRVCRYPYYPKPKFKVHPQDCSVMTYRGCWHNLRDITITMVTKEQWAIISHCSTLFYVKYVHTVARTIL